MKANVKNRQAGFTLIEYIVALVIVAIVAAMLYSFFGTSLTQSGFPILRLQKASKLSNVMENIAADYNRLNAINLRYKWLASTAYHLDFVVTPNAESKKNGHYYKCSGAGTSGTSEPTWPTGTGATVTDGGVTWKESGNIVWQKSNVYGSGTIVVPINNTGHYYKCTAAGTSRATEPTWPTATGGTVTETGGPTWTEAGTVLKLNNDEGIENLFDLLPAVNNTNTRYGTGYTEYTVTEKGFIRFIPGSSPPTPPPFQEAAADTENNILKVTIKNNDSSETLTALFTIR